MHLNKNILFPSIIIGLTFALVLGFLPLFIARSSIAPQEVYPVHSSPTIIPTPTAIPLVKPLNIDLVFNNTYKNNRKELVDLPQNQVVQVVAAGDVMLGRQVGINITRMQNFNYPFELVASKLKIADIAMINLENPITAKCPLMAEGMIFCSTPGTISGLEFAGIDVVNLANNHTLNYGNSGLIETTKYLDQAKIKFSGLKNTISLFEIRGTKVAILGFTAFGGSNVLSEFDRKNIETTLKQAEKISDIQIVNFHWGSEYQPQPSIGQRLLAYAAIDAGADAIIGHHPHWVQGLEIYQQKPIFYSLGNLIFDQMWSEKTREGLIVELNFFQNKIAGIYLNPTYMENIAQPNIPTVGYGNTMLSEIENLSHVLMDSQLQTLELYEPKID